MSRFTRFDYDSTESDVDDKDGYIIYVGPYFKIEMGKEDFERFLKDYEIEGSYNDPPSSLLAVAWM